MANWTWQKWLGKLAVIVVAIGELVLKELEIVNLPWWPIITTAAIAIVQWIVALFPPKQAA